MRIKKIGEVRAVMAICLTAVFAASSALGDIGTWKVREGVGTGGTNWAVWEDSANWEGGVLPSGTERATSQAILPAQSVYINSTDGITLPQIAVTNNVQSESQYPVLRSDATVVITYSDSSYTQIKRFWLYSDYTWKGRGGYSGPCYVKFCGDCTGLTSTMEICQDSSYRFDMFANSTGGTRTYNKLFPGTQPDFRIKGGCAMDFVTPRGSDADVVGTWSQTAGSPFLSRVGAEHVLCAGTTVTGSGIPAGTFLKRVFPDGTIELSQAATSTIAENTLTFAAFSPDFSATIWRLWHVQGNSIATIRAQKHRAADKGRICVSIMQHSAAPAPYGFKITTQDGYVPATLVLGKNVTSTFYQLENCEVEFTGSGKDGDTDFHTCTFRIPNAAHAARLVATNGVVTSLGVFTNRVGTLVKGGAGTISIGLPNDARVNSTGAIIVDEGTLEIRGSDSGDNYVPTLTVKAGATLRIPNGLVCGTFNAEEGAIVEGGVLACGSIDESVLSRIVLSKGAGCRSLVSSGAKFKVEVVSGSVISRNVENDKVCTISGDALFRVTGAGTFDVLLVGGGGGGGYKAGGGGGGGGVVYTQSIAVVDGLYSFSVGAGGHGATQGNERSTNGGDTYGLGLCAYGGGAGGTHYWNGLTGGSGGGANVYDYNNGKEGFRSGAPGIAGQGYAGGSSTNTLDHWRATGGGGGGAGAPAVAIYFAEGPNPNPTLAPTTRVYGADGGDGVAVSITGEEVYYGGGGGGGGNRFVVTAHGGLGGGGQGGVTPYTASNYAAAGEAGEPGTGGGGGGGGCYSSYGGAGGDGGSGVAIIRFLRPIKGFTTSFR